MIAKVALGPSSEIRVIGRCGRTVVTSDIWLKSLRFGRDSRSSSSKIVVALCANFGVAQQAVVSQALLFVLRTSCSGSKFYIRQGERSVVLVWCQAVGTIHDLEIQWVK